MRKQMALFSIILAILPAKVTYAQEKKLTIAVAEFEARQVSASNAVTVSDFLRSALINMDLFTVVERSNMDMIMAEQRLQWSGCTTQDCIVQMGKVLNVKKIIYGNLSKLGKNFYIVANVVDIETGDIEKSAKTRSSSLEEINAVIDNLAFTLAHQLLSKQAIGRTIQPAQGETIETGALYIKSNPTGAVIWLDGENVGRTPQEFKTIPAGIQQIVLAKDGYVDKLVAAQVIANKRNEVTGELMPMLGMALIRSEPSGAKVYLDGEYRGETTGAGLKITSLPIGEHKLLLEKKAFFEYTDKIYIAHKKTNEIKAKLKEKPGALFVTSTPKNAKIYLDGTYKGITPKKIDNVPGGSHNLKLKLEKFQDYIQTVKVNGEKTTSITAELLPGSTKEEIEQPIGYRQWENKYEKNKSNWWRRILNTGLGVGIITASRRHPTGMIWGVYFLSSGVIGFYEMHYYKHENEKKYYEYYLKKKKGLVFKLDKDYTFLCYNWKF